MKENLLRLLLICVMSIFTLSASALRGGTKDYLCFTANTEGSTIALVKKGTPTEVTIEYSIDGDTWYTYEFGTVVTLNYAGDEVYFRNGGEEVASGFSASSSNYYNFTMTGSIAASGNVMSLLDKNCKSTTIPCDYCFAYLFSGCTGLKSAPELPATTLATYCYGYMFDGCTGLDSAPELPATKMADNCYSYMFKGCTSLLSAPELYATTLAYRCCYYMFDGCNKLVSAPELPASELADYCYSFMFNDCASLKSAPELPATTLASNCYYSMFRGCTGLKSAPELPATTLVASCYRNMFQNCSKLENISVACTKMGSPALMWVSSVAPSGTFACPATFTVSYNANCVPLSTTYPWFVKNSFDLTISNVGWASMYVNLPLQIPTDVEGLEVYYASAVNGNAITLTQIEAGTTIAPRTAVLVKGTAGIVSFPIMGESGTSYTDNLFAGTSVDKAFNAAGGAVYVLSPETTESCPAFQNYTGTTLGAHKIWLPKSAVGGTTGAINFVFDDATAINGTDVAVPKSSVRYNLNGQAVGADYKGIVIVNGKKMLMK